MIKRNKKQGFTLVELLIVIAILALLMTILLPALAKFKSIAKRTACLSNLHAAAIGFRMYLDANKYFMPPAARYPSLNLNDKKPIAEFLRPYISGAKTLLCPADNGYERLDYTKRYFESEGSSYEYLETLGNKRVENTYLTHDLGYDESEIHVLYDYKTFTAGKVRKDL